MNATASDPKIIDVIERRVSWRSYADRPVTGAVRAELESTIDSPPAGPFGSSVRLALIEASAAQRKTAKLGTYGVVKGAPLFMAGVVGETSHGLEDFGYVFQWAVLGATELGLGTCWLGGTFKRESFGRALGAGEDEVVPAVSPVGYPRRRRTAVDRVFRWAAGSKKRKPWSELFFDEAQQPLSPAAAAPFDKVLDMVRLGPSASNKQPWRVVRAGDDFHLYLLRSPGYRRRFGVDLQRIDMGIAMCHFERSAQALGLAGGWGDRATGVGTAPEGWRYVASWAASA